MGYTYGNDWLREWYEYQRDLSGNPMVQTGILDMPSRKLYDWCAREYSA